MTEVESFELPEGISEDDECLLNGILSALCTLNLCAGYKVMIPPSQPHLFVIKGQLPNETFEVEMDQMHLIMAASPLRIESILVAKTGEQQYELIIRALNSKQRVMLKESSTFYYVSGRKRKLQRL